jgi:hypothetical protein
LRIEVALTELKGVRLIVAFPGDEYVRPIAGDRLITQLTPYLPPLGIMLVSESAWPRAYAPFQTHEFLPLLRGISLNRFEVDLSVPPEDEDEDELPF